MRRNYFILFILLILTVLFCIAVGSVQISFADLIQILLRPDQVATEDQQLINIVKIIRIPRVLSVMLVGIALSISGVVMQGLLRNPLADGSTLGISSGASLGAVLFILFSHHLPALPFNTTFIGASLGAFLSLVIILAIARSLDRNFTTITIILVGIIFSMLTSSMMSFLITLAGEKLRTIVFWSMGSLSGSSYQDVIVLTVVVTICLGVLWFKSKDLNAFALGEEQARNIGVDVRRSRIIFMIIVSILIGTSVAIAGTIAFVGLIIPHITRMLTGPNHKPLLMSSVFVGGIFLLVADLMARTIAPPKELPIGVITSFIGTLLFLIIFIRQKRGA